ncbi:hypothetical protein PV325_009055 [Microctonus aethiopoides]|uniref:Uncharacterized protein n=1 Tax=Microctonus aethiopoides TaxID=144406 RepID=A0AA39FUC4_9HYME|nr:hypothetical protein PV325_009055 [Microctonus aethiopoides]KAK0095977.1 hypothetical protein PV326_006876 [Microctonus aethiopoides]KAK0175813.1 hypothetical protein PV328_000015 [Microctonus aethiopoides]
MNTNSKNTYKLEYTSHYIKKSQRKIPIFIPHDCYAQNAVQERHQINPHFTILWTLNNSKSKLLCDNYFSDIFHSTYQISYKNPLLKKTELKLTEPLRLLSDTKNKKIKEYDSEYMRYLNNLYCKSQDNKILTLPSTAKRVLGYVSPSLLHGILSSYQDTIGRTGAEIIFDKGKLMPVALQKSQKKF